MSAEPAAPLSELFEAVAARAAVTLEGLIGGDHPGPPGRRARGLPDLRALRAPYAEVCRAAPAAEPAARAMIAPLVDRASADLAAIRAAVRDDPAAPGLEAACLYLLGEMGWLATVYAGPPGGRRAPDPDEYSAEYARVCAGIQALLGLMGGQRDLWRFFRESRAAFRARPPPRRRPRRPMADDAEYYF